MNNQSDLPEGWARVAFPSLCEINPAKPPANALPPDASVTFVPMPAVDAERGVIAKPTTRSFSEVRKGFTAFRDGDVIMAKITPCMENGKAAIARGLQNGLGFGSTEFHVLRSNGTVLPEYVYHFIRQEAFRRAAEDEMTGSVGQKRVPAGFLEQAELPLAPLAEQRRIVAKVEELLARVNAARERLSRVPAILKRFRQAILAAACSGRLSADWSQWFAGERISREAFRRCVEGRSRHFPRYKVPASLSFEGISELPAGWCWASVEELASGEPHSMQSGPFGSNLLHAEFQDQGILAIGIDNVQDGSFSMGREHRISKAKYEELRKYTARPLDVLITVMATVGRVCVVPEKLESAVITKHVYRISGGVLLVLRARRFRGKTQVLVDECSRSFPGVFRARNNQETPPFFSFLEKAVGGPVWQQPV